MKPDFVSNHAWFGVQDDFKEASQYGVEHGLPLAAFHAINRIPHMLDELKRLSGLLEIVYLRVHREQYRSELAKKLFEYLHSERKITPTKEDK